MSSIATIGPKGPARCYRARYRTPDGASGSKTFTRKVDTERFLETTGHRKSTGEFVDPVAGRVTFKTYSTSWLERGLSERVAPTTASAIVFTLAAVLREAVDDNRLSHKPAERIKVGSKTERRVDPLRVPKVAAKARAIAGAMPGRWRAAVLLMERLDRDWGSVSG